jgi:hypothetical protein
LEETEQVIEETTETDPTESAAASLSAAGDEIGALKLRLDAAEKRAKRSETRLRERDLGDYKGELVKEFEYADPELISGATKQAMRASAERIHRAVAAAIEKRGLKPAASTEPPKTKTAEEKAADWGAPPPMAKEAVSGESPRDWVEVQRDAANGTMDFEAARAEILKSGARRIVRPTIAGSAIKVRAEAQASNEAAKS